ncbi:Spy/CpxP family protein refolding chaperone [Pontiella agarivorans]|uniref:Periplasmic heavy metal sensor n=1 Tax=Pontiella agarivorans TaxID=3038953 RepID=A0ABU5MWJ0_9BACT|nr:hypothetical protein [Pontiella agarivorans]MDZ8118572.1 hypothetical protein [Pontiella agarivorans]
MKKQMMMLSAVLLALPTLSKADEPPRGESEIRYEQRKSGHDRDGRRGERRELTPEEREKMNERRLQIMEKTLKELGVTEEQKLQITELQNQMKEQMRAAYLDIEEKKKNLKKMEEESAPQDEIFAAIDEVTDAQAEQMKILARNRIQMERILGKDKFMQFMDKARNKWREHGGRRNGDDSSRGPDREKDKMPPQSPAAP